jgi:hypothetical protein
MELDEALLKQVDATFHQPPAMYNCAQSVAALCGMEDLCEALKAMGGGRAPEGRCGALHAALQLVPEARRQDLIDAFVAEAGAPDCRTIKAVTKFPCRSCVALGCTLAKQLGEK